MHHDGSRRIRAVDSGDEGDMRELGFEVSYGRGIEFSLNWDDHPHFHAEYGREEVVPTARSERL
jgi:hypothetical protein